jgi:hypothetical protein
MMLARAVSISMAARARTRAGVLKRLRPGVSRRCDRHPILIYKPGAERGHVPSAYLRLTEALPVFPKSPPELTLDPVIA